MIPVSILQYQKIVAGKSQKTFIYLKTVYIYTPVSHLANVHRPTGSNTSLIDNLQRRSGKRNVLSALFISINDGKTTLKFSKRFRFFVIYLFAISTQEYIHPGDEYQMLTLCVILGRRDRKQSCLIPAPPPPPRQISFNAYIDVHSLRTMCTLGLYWWQNGFVTCSINMTCR